MYNKYELDDDGYDPFTMIDPPTAALLKRATPRGSKVSKQRALKLWRAIVGPNAHGMVGGGKPGNFKAHHALIKEFAQFVAQATKTGKRR